jgi:hypothetical protein
METRVTGAVVTTDGVGTRCVHMTGVFVFFSAFVDVFTLSCQCSSGIIEAIITRAHEGSLGVQAGSMLVTSIADVSIWCFTFIDISTVCSIPTEAGCTITIEASLSVSARGIRMAVVQGSVLAFINICARLTITFPLWRVANTEIILTESIVTSSLRVTSVVLESIWNTLVDVITSIIRITSIA